MERLRTRFEAEPVPELASVRRHPDPALGDSRILILASMIMLGFQFRSAFEPGLARMPPLYARLELGSMALMILSLGFSAMPATYRGLRVALLPFALSLGLDVSISAAAVAGPPLGWAVGIAAAALAIFLWHGLRSGHAPAPAAPGAGRLLGIAVTPRSVLPGPLEETGDRALAGARAMLPGAQALLGLELSVSLMQGFQSLSASGRNVYVASLGLLALATILFLARRSGRLFVTAMAALALALSGGMYVAASRVATVAGYAEPAAAVTALFLCTVWVVIPSASPRWP